MMEIIVHELPGAPDDPVELLAALRTGPFAFLLESAAGSGARARYTFLGSAPKEAWRYTGRRVEQWLPATGWLMAADTADPIGHIGARMRERPMAGTEALPPFAGGAVGFLGYDVVETLERLPASHPDDLGVPDALFLVADSVIVIDKLEKRTMVVASVEVPETACREERDGLLEDARRRIAAIEARTTGVAALPPLPPASSEVPAAMSRTSGDDFMAGVRAIKGHIAAGDVFQCVLSRRIEVSRRVEPLTLYRSMRELNPAPYLYYLELDGFAIVGGSPEMLVHVEDREVTVRPIAGTRPRGANPPEDASLAAALLADPKERAEHAMLVDLGRNDVGRVAKYGTVRVAESMVLERYTHVQHIVSEV
ncbi:MAG TPA: chorismate-binding protein, partial [Gemmatimonadales bacterium]